MLCLPTPSMFAYYSRASGNSNQRFGFLLCKTTITEFTVLSLVCFIQAAAYEMNDPFLPFCLQALTDDRRLRANEGVIVLLPQEMTANILRRGLLRISSNCTVNSVAANLAFARAGKIDWNMRDRLGCFSLGFAEVTTILVVEWYATSSKRRCWDDRLPETVYLKVAPRYIEKFIEETMR